MYTHTQVLYYFGWLFLYSRGETVKIWHRCLLYIVIVMSTELLTMLTLRLRSQWPDIQFLPPPNLFFFSVNGSLLQMQRSLSQLQQSSRSPPPEPLVHTFPHPGVIRHLPKVGPATLCSTQGGPRYTLHYQKRALLHFILPKVGPTTLYSTQGGPRNTLLYLRWVPLHFILPKVGPAILYSTQGGPRYTLFYSKWAPLHLLEPRWAPLHFTLLKVGPVLH